jgi:hypothetical protein
MMKFWAAKEPSKEAPKAAPKPQRRKPTGQQKDDKPFLLTPFGFFLSGCSVAWTTFSIVDLFGIGAMGLTVAVSLDIIWVAIMYATHKDIPFYGSVRTTQGIGWAFLVAVVILLAWHGTSLEGETVFGHLVDRDMSRGMAVAGPILPVGAKVVWVLISAAYKKAELEEQNPEGYTDEQLEELEDLERKSKFDATKAKKRREADRLAHEDRLEKIRMAAEETRTKDQVDFEIYLERVAQAREIQNNTPMELPRIIQGEIERVPTPLPVGPRSIPATKTTRRVEATVAITDLSEAEQENKMRAAEYWLLHSQDPTYTQNRFAQEKKISAGYLSKILKKYPEEIFSKENSESFESGGEAVGS